MAKARAFTTDMSTSVRLMPKVRDILFDKELCSEVTDATEFLDKSCATDLVCDGWHLAVRVRDDKYLKQYPWDFTIRFSRNTGAETEYSKIVRGFGDRMFYGYANTSDEIVHWWLIDLAIVRLAVGKHGFESFGEVKNNDGDGTTLLALNIDQLSSGGYPSIIAAHDRVLEKTMNNKRHFSGWRKERAGKVLVIDGHRVEYCDCGALATQTLAVPDHLNNPPPPMETRKRYCGACLPKPAAISIEA